MDFAFRISIRKIGRLSIPYHPMAEEESCLVEGIGA